MKDTDEIIIWLKTALADAKDPTGKKKTQEDVASDAGIERSALNKVANGSRILKAFEMLAVARSLGVDLPNAKREISIQRYTPSKVSVNGTIAPGIWREAGASMKLDYAVPVIPEPRLAALQQYALRYEGPDHAKGFRYGDFLIFVPITNNLANIRDSSIVHVERYRDRTTETSICTIRLMPDQTYELRSEREDQPPVNLSNLESQVEDLDIRGVYVGLYRPEIA